MNKRNPLPLWIVVSIFLAAVMSVPLTYWLRSRSAGPPRTVTELRTLTELGYGPQQLPDLVSLRRLPEPAPRLRSVTWIGIPKTSNRR